MEPRYLVYALADLLLVVTIAFMVVGGRRRIGRGRPARLHYGTGLVDFIEGFTGKELSRRTLGMIFVVAVGNSVLAFLIGLAVFLVRRGVFA